MSVEIPHAAADGARGVRLWKIKGGQVRITCGGKNLVEIAVSGSY